MKINISKITNKMKLENLKNIRLLPDDFEPENKHMYCSIGLAVMGIIVAVLCAIFSIIDETKSYLKPATIILCGFIAVFILMTLEIRNRIIYPNN